MGEDMANNLSGSSDSLVLVEFAVTVKGAVKHGESVMFTLDVKKPGSENVTTILREFEDFEWLHHNLVTSNSIGGIIVPPLPIKSMSDPKSAEAISRKQLGDHTKVLKGDQFDVDCKVISIYLNHMLDHPVFGHDSNLITFLDNVEAPVRARLNKGLMTRLSSAIDSARKGGVKDVDEYFAQQRQNGINYNKASKEIYESFVRRMVSQWRLSSSYRSVVTDLTSCTAERDEELIRLNKVLRMLSEGMEDEAASWELRCSQEETGIGSYLDTMARYSDSIKEMHVRRVTAMNEYTACEKALEKAKPVKKQMAEEVFESAKSNYEKITDSGKREIESFIKMRLKFSGEILKAHAEVQMKISQDFYTQLFHTRKAVLEMQL